MHCLIIFLNGSDMSGSHHYTLHILNHLIISYRVFSRYNYKNNELKQEISAAATSVGEESLAAAV